MCNKTGEGEVREDGGNLLKRVLFSLLCMCLCAMINNSARRGAGREGGAAVFR